MENSIGKKVTTVVTVVISAVLIFCAIQSNVPCLEKYEHLLVQHEELLKSNTDLRLKLDELREKQTRFAEDPEFVADVARENGYMYQGEIVFTYTPEGAR